MRVVVAVSFAVVGSFFVGCPGPGEKPVPTTPVVFGTTEGLPACDDANVAAHPEARCFTSRAVAGVSMGGGTAGRIGFRHPELWDVVGIMGTPFADNEFFFQMLKDNHMGGFCSLEVLEQAMRDGKDLDDASDPSIFCGVHDVFPLVNNEQVTPGYFPAVENSGCSMFRSDFNHWYRGPEAGRGGSFSRNGLIDIMHDLVAANGNPFYENGDEFYFPKGVPETWHIPPQDPDAANHRAALCANPVVINGVFNREYNPDGTYPVITFCDGNARSGDDDNAGDYIPGEGAGIPVEFLLAVDLNGNGKRDYAEPVLINNEERYRDCGSDGKCDGEAGDTDDNWDPLTNPTGTEKNFRLDDGEDFDDDGLDGVADTADFGEGNGVFDRAPALQALIDDSPNTLLDTMPADQAKRLDVWMDAGVRDFLNTAQTSNALFAELKKALPEDTKVYNDFGAMPIDQKYVDGGDRYIYYMSDYSRKAMGQIAYLRYGNTDICPGSDENEGEGNHVGAGDVVSRIFTLFSFLSARMPAQGRDESFGGQIIDLAPTRNLSDFAFLTNYQSPTLGREVEYGVLLPPDYFLPEAEANEYPVLYFFHGQGMNAADMVALGLALIGPMKESARTDRIGTEKTDLQRAIIIWVDGECKGDACFTGNFYADFKGLPRDDKRFETAFYELVRHVEETYRTLPPQMIPLDQIEN